MKKLLVTITSVLFQCLVINVALAQSPPQCLTSTSDPDGDGYGWENEQSCVVDISQQVQAVSGLDECDVRYSSDGMPFCLDSLGNDLLPVLTECEDNDGDGVQSGNYGSSCQANTNLVRNGSFVNGSAGWNTYLHPDSISGPYIYDPNPYASNFEFRSEGEEVIFAYRRAGTQWWHSQLFTDPISLEGGRSYRLSFHSYTNPRGGRPVGSVVVENGTDYTKYLDRQNFDVGTLVNRFYFAEFYVPASDSNARVTFNLGDNYGGNNSANTGFLVIMNVRLVALNDSTDQQAIVSSCDYTNSLLHGGWGWNPVTEESCPPQTSETTVCIDSDGDGWGWDGASSCRVQ